MKILLNIYVPSISESFDVLVPDFLTVNEIIPLLGESIEQISNSRYMSSNTEFLCHAENNVLLRGDLTLRDYGIRNGDHLVIT